MPMAGLPGWGNNAIDRLSGGGGGEAPEIVGISCDQISGDNWLAEREREPPHSIEKRERALEAVVTKIPLQKSHKSG
jgi:hypothetical protein